MSTEIPQAELSQNPTNFVEDQDWWDPPMPPTDLIFDDGEPLESNRHRIGINVLIRSLLQAFADRNDYFAGGNMFVYYSSEQAKNREFRGPDFFAVLDVDGSYPRQGWVVWNEAGRYPDVIIELMSPSTARIDLTTKKILYERTFKTLNYFVYDPFDANSLQGWQLGNSGHYEELTHNDEGWLWCEALELWVGTWDGTIDKETSSWLRFYDQQKNLIPLPEEFAQLQAETERQRAETERQRAEIERQRAETERQRAERLATRLKELGEDPENF
ncbi:protein of unknown function DUF820 [Gloeothece citriformis PCC 7424]|uniref:Putative restriction endonuclease domain-containing protein n=1 Tax=Gloeothece citriformis (strain PCC 7424) TaxID=65393 RepID=B7K6Y7_GLOC7|nr:Uma2 family endonuclease [Gloeothece citriformis]ACK72686.1 protein of unknown function DUF820 [Gloeothece citriformis PCC 7424]